MEQALKLEVTLEDIHADRYGYLRPSALLYLVQEAAGKHSDLLGTDFDTLQKKGLFWAVTRHGVTVERLPRTGERISLETWPMPASRVAYPRMVEARDENGQLLFQVLSLWVLMDVNTRAMILPGKSGIALPGTVRGNELEPPASLPAKSYVNHRSRTVCFTDLDRNGHMNNTKYLDWIADLFPSAFHFSHCPVEFTVCYLSEAREGQELILSWEAAEDGTVGVDAHRYNGEKPERIFSARLCY